MARKRTAPTEEIPLAFSSDEEISGDEAVESRKPSSTPPSSPNKVISSQSDSEDATNSDDSDSETETATNNSKIKSISQMTEKTIGTKKPQSKAASVPETATTKSKTAVKDPEPDSEDATDSDDSASDSERETEIKKNSKIESVSKMTEKTIGTKKPQSKTAASTETATKSKRASEKEPELKPFKRARTEKITSNVTTNQSKRMWSEEDELSLLTGMIDFISKEKISPAADVELFIKFIKNSLEIEVTRTRLTAKMRRMKKKYVNNTVKEDRGIVFSSKGHDFKIHDLSKKIWGAKITNGVGAGKVSDDLNIGTKMAGRKLAMESENDTSLDLIYTDLMKNYNRIGDADLETYVLNEGLSLLEESKRTYFENKWKSLQSSELELFVKRMELMTEQSKNVLEAHKAAYN